MQRYVKTVTFLPSVDLWSAPDKNKRSGGGAMRYLRWLTTNLLIAYLAGVAVQQVWAVLNWDVREVVRRLH